MTVKKEQAICRYIGAASDTKPTGTTVPVGSTFFEYDTSDTYITYDSTNWVLKKASKDQKLKIVRSVKTLAASAAYVANDVLSESISTDVATHWQFLSVVDANGGSGIITHAQVMAETSSASGDITLYLFSASPSGTLRDNLANTAPTYNDVTASKLIGKIDFPLLVADSTTGEAVALATPYTASSGLPLPFICASATNVIYGIAVANNAWSPAPSTDLMFALTIERN